MVRFSHRYLNSDCINFKTFVFLAVYWSIWTSSYNTDIKVQQFFIGALTTMLNNVFNICGLSCCILWNTQHWFLCQIVSKYLPCLPLLNPPHPAWPGSPHSVLSGACCPTSASIGQRQQLYQSLSLIQRRQIQSRKSIFESVGDFQFRVRVSVSVTSHRRPLIRAKNCRVQVKQIMVTLTLKWKLTFS